MNKKSRKMTRRKLLVSGAGSAVGGLIAPSRPALAADASAGRTSVYEALGVEHIINAAGNPSIEIGRVRGTGDDGLLISVFMLQEGEDQIVAARLREILISALV